MTTTTTKPFARATSLTGTRNIVAVFDLAAQSELASGMDWYERASTVAENLSHTYDINTATAAGVIAALSPNNRWERNTVDAENVIRAYVDGSPDDAMQVKVCTYGKMQAKAIKILEADDLGSTYEIASILNGRKITAFFWCIIGEHDAVCIDGHAYSIWFGDRLTMKEVPNIGKKLYNAITTDYVDATQFINERDGGGLMPFQVQAITWCVWRRLHRV